nr:hypothetical protein [Tanacetum cinerariifolium]
MTREIKESDACVNYLAKYLHAQSGTPTQGQGQENKKQRILKEIKKALGECLGAKPASPDHSDSSKKSIRDSTDDDKTESENDYDHEAECDNSNTENKSVDFDNDDSGKDYDAEEDQDTDFMIHPHDKEPKQP